MIKKAAEVIKNSDFVLITAGAGMGVDSGLPDFRGDEGFWKAYPIAKKLGLNFQALANPRWFEINPKLAWAFYGHRLNLYRNTTPHRGFEILKNLPQDKFVFTSNVDGHFQKAGFDEEKIVEIHGSIHYLQCNTPCFKEVWENNFTIEVDMEKFEAKNFPLCPYCKKIARPNILMFSDFYFVETRLNIQLKNLRKWLNKINGKIAVIEIGAGKAVPTVRNFSEEIRYNFNSTLIRINPRDADGADIPINEGALSALEKIEKYLKGFL